MTDLDLGMNDHISDPFEWDDNQKYDRGKVLNADDLEHVGKFGRYLDVDGDGIPYRTYPGTHPTKGAFFTRGTSRDEYAAYTEDGAAYKRNMDRLMVKWETAKKIVPSAQLYQKKNHSNIGILFFGTSAFSSEEAKDLLQASGTVVDAIRLKAFPFGVEVVEFVNSHELVFIIEQNRDAQMRSMMIIEMETNPSKLIPVLNYDGMPITADAIKNQITSFLDKAKTQNHELYKTTV